MGHDERMVDLVLVHGAWHGAWCWRRVLPALWRAGGWAAAALLAAFVPAHLHTFRVVPRRALPMTVAAVRLPLQAPLIRIALDVARGR